MVSLADLSDEDLARNIFAAAASNAAAYAAVYAGVRLPVPLAEAALAAIRCGRGMDSSLMLFDACRTFKTTDSKLSLDVTVSRFIQRGKIHF